MSEQYQDSSDSLTIKNYEFLPDGTLKCWARIAKSGVYDYGSHKEEIPESTLFDSASLNSIVGRPITLEHPPSFIMSVSDRAKYQIGTALQEAVKEIDNNETYLTIPMIIWDKPAIDAIVEKKVNQFSPGYHASKEKTDSKIIQKDRRYNHFSLTANGRGGESVRALVDSNVTLQTQPENTKETMQVNGTTTETPVQPQQVPEIVPNPPTQPMPTEPVTVPATPAQTPQQPTQPQQVPETQTDSIGTVETLVRLHSEYRDSFTAAGIVPDYKWTSTELKRRIVALKTGKDATNLNESQCDAVLSFLETGTQAKETVTVPTQTKDSVEDCESKYLQRLENAYKTR